MKNVLFLTNTLDGGGAERALVNLVNRIDKRKYNITVRTIFNGGVNRKYINADIKQEAIFKKRFRGVKYLFALLPKRLSYRIVTGGHYDIVVVYLHGVLTKVISWIDEPATKKIAWLHADMNKSGFMKSFSNMYDIKKCFSKYDAIVGVSRTVADSFIKNTGIVEKIHVKYNTVDVNEIIQKGKESVEENIFNTYTTKLIGVGRLTEEKGFERLLRIVKRLIEENFNISLYILGDRGQKDKLESYIYENNLSGRIFLLGYKENPYKYVSKCDLFVCSSFTEGLSTAVSESIILGTPVITTLCSGMEELLGDNCEYGFIVDNDEGSLYEGIKRLLSDKALLQHYRRMAETRRNFFNPLNSVKEVEKLLDEVCECIH